MMGHKHLFLSWKNLELPLVITAGKAVGSLTMTECVSHSEKSGEAFKSKSGKQLKQNFKKSFTETLRVKVLSMSQEPPEVTKEKLNFE